MAGWGPGQGVSTQGELCHSRPRGEGPENRDLGTVSLLTCGCDTSQGGVGKAGETKCGGMWGGSPELHMVVPLACWTGIPLSIRNESIQAVESGQSASTPAVYPSGVTLGRCLPLSEPSFLASGNEHAPFTGLQGGGRLGHLTQGLQPFSESNALLSFYPPSCLWAATYRTALC